MNIKQQIKNNYHLLKEIENLTGKIEINQNLEKDYLFAGFYRNSLVHYYSINILVEKMLYNSAFALVRVLFENVIKGNYLYYYFNDSEINALINKKNWSNLFPTIEEMCIKFPRIDNVHQSLFKHIKNKTYQVMNDYIHTGHNQIARNFNDDTKTIESNFNDDELFAILELINLIILPNIKIYMGIGIKQNYLSNNEVEKLFLLMEAKYEKWLFRKDKYKKDK